MSIRTQVYLTEAQRARLDAIADRDGVSMAEVLRRAVDAYVEPGDDLDATFGAAAGRRITVPSRDEWDRG